MRSTNIFQSGNRKAKSVTLNFSETTHFASLFNSSSLFVSKPCSCPHLLNPWHGSPKKWDVIFNFIFLYSPTPLILFNKEVLIVHSSNKHLSPVRSVCQSFYRFQPLCKVKEKERRLSFNTLKDNAKTNGKWQFYICSKSNIRCQYLHLVLENSPETSNSAFGYDSRRVFEFSPLFREEKEAKIS